MSERLKSVDFFDPAASARECIDGMSADWLDALPVMTAFLERAYAAGVEAERARLRAEDWDAACNGLVGLITIARGVGLSWEDIVDKLREAIKDLGNEIQAALRAPEAPHAKETP